MKYESHKIPSRPGPVSIAYRTDDGRELRRTRKPGADISDLPKKARDEISAVWTPEYVAGWNAEMAQLESDLATQKAESQAEAAEIERARKQERAKLLDMETRLAAIEAKGG